MPSEDKVKIKDIKGLRLKLTDLSAELVSSTKVKDTYFNQPIGTVLKIRTEEGKLDRVIHFKKVIDGFEALKTQDLPLEILKEELKAKFGVDKVIEKTIETFKISEVEIALHQILNLGNFLVICHGNRTCVAETFDLEESDFFSTPFNEL